MNDRVELDRLADYAAGVLDGTPQAEEIAHLIAAEPAWTAAYAELVNADQTLRGELAALRTVDEPMPAEVAARLDAALAAAAADRSHTAGSADPVPDTRSRTAGTHRADRPRSRTDGRTPGSAARARHRRRAWTLVAVAAGVLALGGVGVPVVSEVVRSRGDVSSGMTQRTGPEVATEGEAPPAAGAPERGPVL
ncbi:MAG TPA: hypothetical protein VFM54_06835, partial [Micromonosporaceae bacterium]|nr:hypothetical protein [Micromonosporaceae bacterium]